MSGHVVDGLWSPRTNDHLMSEGNYIIKLFQFQSSQYWSQLPGLSEGERCQCTRSDRLWNSSSFGGHINGEYVAPALLHTRHGRRPWNGNKPLLDQNLQVRPRARNNRHGDVSIAFSEFSCVQGLFYRTWLRTGGFAVWANAKRHSTVTGRQNKGLQSFTILRDWRNTACSLRSCPRWWQNGCSMGKLFVCVCRQSCKHTLPLPLTGDATLAKTAPLNEATSGSKFVKLQDSSVLKVSSEAKETCSKWQLSIKGLQNVWHFYHRGRI